MIELMRKLSIAGLLILILLAFSFFATTWIAMIIGGMAGHLTHSQYLMHLGFWKYSPIWITVILLKFMF